MTLPIDRPSWTIREAAALLDVSPSTLYRLAKADQLPGAFKVGGSLRVSIETLAAAYGLPSPLRAAA